MGVQFITQMDGEQQARIRRLLMPAFSARSLARIEARITEIIDGMLDKIEQGGNDFDGMRDYGAQLVVGALLMAMVQLDERQKQVFVAFHEVLPLTTYTKPGEAFAPECQRAFARAAEVVNEIIVERRAKPRQDFISDLILARDQGDKLNDRELFDQIFTICGAALSATSRSAGGALYTLYSHPDQLQQLIRDPNLIRGAVEACLRIASNGYFTFPRRATCDTEVGGRKYSKAWWCGPRRRPPTMTPMFSPIRSGSISIATRSGSWRSVPDRTIASATFWAGQPSRLRSRAFWRASRMPDSPIRSSFRPMEAPSASCAWKACQ